ncbi:hypothetical protein K437DRAFT_250952 [Tilletiaria anomala UBC 951]|uniref:RAVE complex protein Rav1 C-terminal domain-containing protein n=1 Tax=Tilletiaria anomala (strain ATCC 24038 / CBS 436.72 / UBC 951) TaxID=1037660 RepID=A0A066VFC4_TILAU|nr:uncharacterized protein K437DRAFT_250952 [Tilletiaria anomala UBC 951]KDN39003.1 hypothetical protein K437DRAFT_250952 [Tilletiaria anomala UBC 951]
METPSIVLPTLPLAFTYPGGLEPSHLIGYGHATSHLVLTHEREVIIAHARADRIQFIDSNNHEIESAVSFTSAFAEEAWTRSRDMLVRCVALGQPESMSSEVLTVASQGKHIGVWHSTSPAKGVRRWTVHSTWTVPEEGTNTHPLEVLSLSMHRGKVLVGTTHGLSVWTLNEGSRVWKKLWGCKAPAGKIIASALWSPDGAHFAACLNHDRRVLIWGMATATQKLEKLGIPFVLDRLVLPRKITSIHWRRSPTLLTDGAPTSVQRCEVLVVRTREGVCRIYSPVIDQPSKFRLWASVDEGSFGLSEGISNVEPTKKKRGSTIYFDAGDLSIACNVSLQHMQQELQMLELGIGTSAHTNDTRTFPAVERDVEQEKRKDLLRTRVRRLEHFMQDTPDMFMRIQEDGEIVVRGTANVDRTPPSLVQSFTALKIHHRSSLLAKWMALAQPLSFTPLIPTGTVAHSHIPYPSYPSAAMTLVSEIGACSTALISPELLFDGHDSGLRVACSAIENKPSRQGHRRRITSLTTARSGELLSLAETCSSACEVIRWSIDASGKLCQLTGAVQVPQMPIALATLHDSLVCSSSDGIFVHDRLHSDKVAREHDAAHVVALLSIGSPHEEGVLGIRNDGHCLFVKEGEHAKARGMLPMDPSSRVACAGLIQDGATLLCCALLGNETLVAWVSLDTSAARWVQLSSHQVHGKRDAAIQISRNGKVALTGIDTKTGANVLLIWDSKSSEFSDGMEHCETMKAPVISLSWNAECTVLALALDTHIEILTASRWRYDSDRGSRVLNGWQRIGKLHCHAWCPRIDSLSFAKADYICVASANIIRSFSPISTDGHRQRAHLQELAARTNGPVRQYHPDFLQQCLLWGYVDVAKTIILHLHSALRHTTAGDVFSVQEVDLLAYRKGEQDFTGTSESKSSAYMAHNSLFANVDQQDSHSSDLTEAHIEDLQDRLPSSLLSDLDGSEQINLKRMARVTLEVDEQKGALDSSGVRYLVALRDFAARAGTDIPGEHYLDHRDILWAFHSETQEMIVSAVDSLFQGKVTWPAAKATGLFMWLGSQDSLRSQAENVARSQFMAGEDRDPVSCSLLYFALGKQKLVHSLWRQAVWHPEQRKMIAFLANNFTEDRWKAAALKNAFVLLSQRRFEFAATFFMLADSLKDAVNVCVRYLNDVQLAIALCRIREGRSDGPILLELLKDRVLPLAFETGNRCLASWAFWMLNRRDLAVQVIVTPFPELLADAEVAQLMGTVEHCAFGYYGDASLALLLADLKGKTAQTALGLARIPVDQEWRFVLYANHVLGRLGCHMLGLLLLRDWVFDRPDISHIVKEPSTNSKLMSRRRSSLLVNEIGDSAAVLGSKSASAAVTTAQVEKSKKGSMNALFDEPEEAPIHLTAATNPLPAKSAALASDAAATGGEGAPKPKGFANLMKAAANDQQHQAAQSFDFGSFDF